MNIGFLSLHPVTVPFSNELFHTVRLMLNQAALLYSVVIKPELTEIAEVFALL